MTIYFFTRNPETGIVYAGCKAGVKRFTAPVWRQGLKFYVQTGAAITGDLERHIFTPTQVVAFVRFVESGADNLEEWGGIA